MIVFLNTLLVFKYIATILEVAAVLAIFAIGADLLFYTTKHARVEKKITPAPSSPDISPRPAAVEDLLDRAKKLAQDRLRRQKEEEEAEGFFGDNYIPGFHSDGRLIYRGAKVPASARLDFYETIDKLADTQIFDNTEGL